MVGQGGLAWNAMETPIGKATSRARSRGHSEASIGAKCAEWATEDGSLVLRTWCPSTDPF